MAMHPYGPATHVLDSSAILAVFLDEDGADGVFAAGPDGLVSAVNASEVIAKMSDRGTPPTITSARLDALGLYVAPFGLVQARQAAALRPATRKHNVSFADRACLALGLETQLPILTGDQGWAELGLRADIRLIR